MSETGPQQLIDASAIIRVQHKQLSAQFKWAVKQCVHARVCMCACTLYACYAHQCLDAQGRMPSRRRHRQRAALPPASVLVANVQGPWQGLAACIVPAWIGWRAEQSRGEGAGRRAHAPWQRKAVHCERTIAGYDRLPSLACICIRIMHSTDASSHAAACGIKHAASHACIIGSS